MPRGTAGATPPFRRPARRPGRTHLRNPAEPRRPSAPVTSAVHRPAAPCPPSRNFSNIFGTCHVTPIFGHLHRQATRIQPIQPAFSRIHPFLFPCSPRPVAPATSPHPYVHPSPSFTSCHLSSQPSLPSRYPSHPQDKGAALPPLGAPSRQFASRRPDACTRTPARLTLQQQPQDKTPTASPIETPGRA